MIKFNEINEKSIQEIIPFTNILNQYICGNSVGCLLVWNKLYNVDYAICEDCIIFAVINKDYKKNIKLLAFTYPKSISGDKLAEARVLDSLEKMAVENNSTLNFFNLNIEELNIIISQYKTNIHILNDKNERDYVYNLADLRDFTGGKFSGQRNHINKFKKLYPQYVFKEYTENLEEKVLTFLDEYNAKNTAESDDAITDFEGGKYLIKNIKNFNLCCGLIEVDGNIVALSIGEYMQESLIIHIEKALTAYEGAYPTMVSEFLKYFQKNNIKYVNREDDDGEIGLRRSKTQYKPIFLTDKYVVKINKNIDKMTKLPVIKTKRLVLSEIDDRDKIKYKKLNLDDELNKYWGYDYRDDLACEIYDNYFLDVVKKDFEDKTCINFGIYLSNKFIGEILLYNFNFKNEAEVGIRVFGEYSGKGYASEAITSLTDYMLVEYNLEKIVAKCYKENICSKNMLLKCGMKKFSEDETFFYFIKEC